MNTKVIIDKCLLSIGEPDPASPIDMTRAEVLEWINHAYQNAIGKRLNYIKLFQYDASDADHTITAGVASLPSDYLGMERVYDGDPATGALLTQIKDIAQKVADDAKMSQYMLPSKKQIWFFGQTPTSTVRLYHKAKPPALTDEVSSEPEYLNEDFHEDFQTYIKMIYADRMDNFNDYLAKKAEWLDILDAIEHEHKHGRQDNAPVQTVDMYGVEDIS